MKDKNLNYLLCVIVSGFLIVLVSCTNNRPLTISAGVPLGGGPESGSPLINSSTGCAVSGSLTSSNSGTSISQGQSIFWQVSASSSCASNFQYIRQNQSPIGFSSSAGFNQVYSQPGSFVENVTVNSLDGSGKVIGVAQFISQTINVAGTTNPSPSPNSAPTCFATVISPSSVNIRVDQNGYPLDPVPTFEFQISSFVPVKIINVQTLPGTLSLVTPLSSLSPGVSQTVKLKVNAMNSNLIAFTVQDPNNSSALTSLCYQQVQLVPIIMSATSAPTPLIYANGALVGTSVPYGANVSIRITSGNTSTCALNKPMQPTPTVALSGGNYTLDGFTGPLTASTTFSVLCTGLGGSSSANVTISVAVAQLGAVFGGAFGYYTSYSTTTCLAQNSTPSPSNPKCPYPNPVTTLGSCPSGFSAIKVYGSPYGGDYLDNDFFICLGNQGMEDSIDFGGMWGNGGSANYPNPFTGGYTCPSGYTDSILFGTWHHDYAVHLCTKPHVAGVAPAHSFGGMYSDYYTNPLTSGKTCPSGFTSSKVLGTAQFGKDVQDYNLYYCYK